MKKIYLFLVIALGAAFNSSFATAVEPDETADRLKACAKITEAAARIACYEALGRETLAEGADSGDVTAGGKAESTTVVAASGNAESPTAAAASAKAETTTAATATGAAVTTATVPATSAPTNVPIKGDRPPEEYRVAVSSCQINNVGDTYFTLDNGEVWKLTGGQQLRESDCVFSATLRKDFFGYKMLIDDDRGTVRVKRVK